MCLCAAQHINLLSNSGRQACACCSECFSQSVGVAVCFSMLYAGVIMEGNST